MSGINSGILQNASPLSAEAIKELERKVLETGEAYAYLDQNSKLCFAMPHGIEGIQELAWNSAYELSSASGTLTKKAYKKTGLKTFTLDKTFTKSSIDEPWLSNSIFRFYGDFANYDYDAVNEPIKLVKVSNKFFSKQELQSGTISIYTNLDGLDGLGTPGIQEYAASHPVLVWLEEQDAESGLKLSAVTFGDSGMPFVLSMINPDPTEYTDFPNTGTYFMYLEGDDTGDGVSDTIIYTVSISCLTEADAIQPIERLGGDGQEFYTAAPAALSFRSTAPLNEFQEVQINGQTIDPSNYTLEEGSTIVKFSIDYLNTLDAGTHNVAIVSKNKTVAGQFNVSQPKVNEYGFCYNTPYAIPAEMASVVESHACVILTDKQLEWLDDPLPLAVVCVNNAYRGFGLYRIDGQTLNLATFDEMFNLSVQVISPYELLVGMDVDGEQQQLPMAINGDPVYYASDGAHLYVLNGDEESYAASSVGLAMDKPYPILTGVNGLPTTAISSRGYEGVAYPGCLEIPNTVIEIGEKAFAGLSASVHIPNSVEFIGHATFLEYLSIIYIDSLEHWCGINFDGQQILAGARIYINDNPVDGELVIPDSVSVISPGAFVDYNQITSIVLPATTARLTNAFGGSNLQTIVYKGTVAQWNALPKDEDWLANIGTGSATYVQCSDGQVAIR